MGRKTIPDKDGQRFCIHCCAYLPVSSFSTSRRRHVCLDHIVSIYKRRNRRKVLESCRSCPFTAAATAAHCYASRDARRLFKVSARITVEELKQVVSRQGQRILPIHPLQPLSMDNLVVIDDPCHRSLLLQGWCAKTDPTEYARLLQILSHSSRKHSSE